MKNSIRNKIMIAFLTLTSVVLVFSIITLYVISNNNEHRKLLSELDKFVKEKQYNFNELISTINNCGIYVIFDENITDMLNSNPENEYEMNRILQTVRTDEEKIYEMNLEGKIESYSVVFYVNNNLPVARLLLSDKERADRHIYNGFRMYSDKEIGEEAWYKDVLSGNGRVHINTLNNILCVSIMIKNEGIMQKNEKYLGVAVVCIDLNKIILEFENIGGYKALAAAKKDDSIIVKSAKFDEKCLEKNRKYYNRSFETDAGIEFVVSIKKDQIGVDRKSLLIILLIYFIITLILGLMLSVVMSRIITTPITNLAGMMREIRNTHNYDCHCEKVSNDEIGELYESFNYMTDSIKTLLKEVEEETQKRCDIEYKLYQNRINPHMLYNTLDSISWRALMLGNEDIVKMNSLLANIYRYSVKHSDTLVTVQEELDCVKMYIELQQLRNDYSIVLNIEANGCENILMPPFILQPLIENSLIHGYEAGMEKLIINISFESDGKDVKAIIENNGKKCDVEEINKLLKSKADSQKLGLKNVNARINLKFGNGYGLSVKKSKTGNTQVIIIMPVIKSLKSSERKEENE